MAVSSGERALQRLATMPGASAPCPRGLRPPPPLALAGRLCGRSVLESTGTRASLCLTPLTCPAGLDAFFPSVSEPVSRDRVQGSGQAPRGPAVHSAS